MINKYRCHAKEKECSLLWPTAWQGRDPRFVMCLTSGERSKWDIVERGKITGGEHRVEVT